MASSRCNRNKNPRSKTTYPLLVDAQADLLNELQARLAISLMKAPALTKNPIARLTPSIDIDGQRYLLMTPQSAGIARSELGAAVGCVADQKSAIIAALDLLITGRNGQWVKRQHRLKTAPRHPPVIEILQTDRFAIDSMRP